MEKIEQQAITALRVLSAEGVEKANSGHPGLPLGAAPMGYTLFAKHLKHNPKNPNFVDRDRFVLSAGHGSMLLYSLLHCFNYGITKEDLMGFRQLKTRTPGHPEYGVTPGVETSTGPLGQGLANAVGFAVAEKMLAAKFNKPNFNLIDHYTYALCGDGCMQEGIESEAASLAGTWQLNKLIVLYDSNNITIEGDTSLAFTEDVAKRHEAQGWSVIKVDDGEDIDAISAAIYLAKKSISKPTLIIVKTTIGFGSTKAGSADSHGAPLGADNVNKLKKALSWNTKQPFEVMPEVVKHYQEISSEFVKYESEWNKIAKTYKSKFQEDYDEFIRWTKGKCPDLTEIEDLWKWGKKADSTRNQSGILLNKLSEIIPNLVGGSADLAPSTKTYLNEKGDFSALTPEGRNFHFGIREHAMAAIVSGIAIHGGFVVYCSTFFVFSDYMKNAMRMAAIMNLPVIYILTHDSIGVGEDGPTHQPVEQLIALRSIPGLKVFRPADGKETSAAYKDAINGKGPSAIICSRQNLEVLPKTNDDVFCGGYVLSNSKKEIPDAILMATGSEVSIALSAKVALLESGIDARVVSMPCMELFDAQTLKYRESVLPSACRARIAIEAGSSYSWGKYVGLDGAYITMDNFGASAPADKLFLIYGFTSENAVNVTKKVVKNLSKSTLVLPVTEVVAE